MTPGRNDPCPCGSGAKYKKCCQAKTEAAAPRAALPAAGPSPAECNQLASLFHAGELARVESRARLMLAQYPESGFVWNVLGASLGMQGKDSLTAFQKAARYLPRDADVQSNLGSALAHHGRYEEAEECFRRALSIKPTFASAYTNLGNALGYQGRTVEATECYRRALRLQPDLAEAHGGLGDSLSKLGQVAEAEAHVRRALQIKPDYTRAHSCLLFLHNFRLEGSAESMLAEARRFGEQVAQRARPGTAWSNSPEPERCLRIGLVSPDLGQHPVGYFLESVLAALASQAEGQLEFFAYAQRTYADTVSEALQKCCRGWCSTATLEDAALAQKIRDDRIDVLIDLAGHTADNRLPVFAFRPAPVQVTWLGYFATTGVAAIDHLLADAWSLPPSEEGAFTEHIWRMPETRLCFTPPPLAVAVAALPALATGQVTFGCFNNLTKMNDGVVLLWSRVLAAVPGSRLFLKAPQLGEPTVRRSVLERFGAHGIGAERLILEAAESRAGYLAAYNRVDIALDPVPFPGGTTSAESLWMGVPVLTLAGERFVSRQGVSLLQNVGLPEWIAADGEEYVARAVSHAADLPRLAALREGLRQKLLASPFCDAPRFARHFAAALRGMWAQWCSRA
ncbi:MAG: tetratricopeptide repeat protein [Planctomycetes bacterium]|nr:tetratricopeptide repeat protein [Planctomycetota bacterium]